MRALTVDILAKNMLVHGHLDDITGQYGDT